MAVTNLQVVSDNFTLYSLPCPGGYGITTSPTSNSNTCTCSTISKEIVFCEDDQDSVILNVSSGVVSKMWSCTHQSTPTHVNCIHLIFCSTVFGQVIILQICPMWICTSTIVQLGTAVVPLTAPWSRTALLHTKDASINTSTVILITSVYVKEKVNFLHHLERKLHNTNIYFSRNFVRPMQRRCWN